MSYIFATRLTRSQLQALRSIAQFGHAPTPYMHKILRKKGLMFSYVEVTKKGWRVLQEYSGVYLAP